jgi:hypothetical protein
LVSERSISRMRAISPTAEVTMSWDDNVAFMWTTSTSVLSLAIKGGAEEMCPRILTRRVYVIILGVFAHGDCLIDRDRSSLLSVRRYNICGFERDIQLL